MRKIVAACLLGLIVVGDLVLVGPSFAQSSNNQQHGKQKERPPAPPPPRCPDLGVGRSAFLSAVPGQAPLADQEIAVQWDVHNDGTAPYQAGSANEQSVALEFTSPAGARRLAVTAVPAGATGSVTLEQGGTWHGVTRALVPPEARGRPLRLHLIYAADGYHAPIHDCDTNNNTVNLVRPTASAQ